MRHRVRGKHLGRSTKHRKALFKNLILALIENGRVKTTEAKAKAIKGLVDKLVTRAKKGTVHSRRLLGSFLHTKKAVNRLVDEITPRFKARASGFTRIVNLGRRRGDDTMMVSLEFVDEQETTAVSKSAKKSAKKSKTTKTQTLKQTSALKPQTKISGKGISSKAQATTRTTHK